MSAVALKNQDLKYWYLSRNEFFFQIALQERAWLDHVVHLEKIPRGEIIYLPGDAADRIYILKQGRVRISRLSPEGKQITLLLLKSGTLFGELALLDESSCHSNIAETLEDTYLCWISKENFQAFLNQHPELNLKLIKLVGQRMREIENNLEDLVFCSVEERLQRLLQKLARQHGEDNGEGVRIVLKLTHEEIGQLINATRPTVSEILKKLQRAKLIRVVKRHIVVLPELLAA